MTVRIKRTILAVIITILAICIVNYWGDSFILERPDVFQFNVVEKHKGDQTILQIKGLCGHSAYAAKSYTLRTNLSDLVIMVNLVHAHGNLSGSFDYSVAIPPQVNRVLFGKKEQLIWTRSEAP
jgi:hypothetical protein